MDSDDDEAVTAEADREAGTASMDPDREAGTMSKEPVVAADKVSMESDTTSEVVAVYSVQAGNETEISSIEYGQDRVVGENSIELSKTDKHVSMESDRDVQIVQIESGKEVEPATMDSNTDAEKAEKKPFFSPNFIKKVTGALALFLLRSILSSQQSCVLLPVTAVSFDPVSLPGPKDSLQAICYHKWAIVGIPYGVPMVVASFLGFKLVFAILSRDTSSETSTKTLWISLFAMFLFSGALLLLLTGVGLICFWLFAGFGIGIWFTFGYVEVFSDLAFIKIFSGPSTFVFESLSIFLEQTIGKYSSTSPPINFSPGIAKNLNSQGATESLTTLYKTSLSKLGLFMRFILPSKLQKPSEPNAGDETENSSSEPKENIDEVDNENASAQPAATPAFRRNQIVPTF
jgi:hypothetical protein